MATEEERKRVEELGRQLAELGRQLGDERVLRGDNDDADTFYDLASRQEAINIDPQGNQPRHHDDRSGLGNRHNPWGGRDIIPPGL